MTCMIFTLRLSFASHNCVDMNGLTHQLAEVPDQLGNAVFDPNPRTPPQKFVRSLRIAVKACHIECPRWGFDEGTASSSFAASMLSKLPKGSRTSCQQMYRRRCWGIAEQQMNQCAHARCRVIDMSEIKDVVASFNA
jgi:hypothetical protein